MVGLKCQKAIARLFISTTDDNAAQRAKPGQQDKEDKDWSFDDLSAGDQESQCKHYDEDRQGDKSGD